MSEHSYIGSFYSDPRRNRPSLGELVTGARQLDIRADGISGEDNDNDGVTIDDEGRESGRKVAKVKAPVAYKLSARKKTARKSVRKRKATGRVSSRAGYVGPLRSSVETKGLESMAEEADCLKLIGALRCEQRRSWQSGERVTADPPATETFLNLPSATNPIH